jgi:hypothetical protein
MALNIMRTNTAQNVRIAINGNSTKVKFLSESKRKRLAIPMFLGKVE